MPALAMGMPVENDGEMALFMAQWALWRSRGSAPMMTGAR